MDKRIIDMQTAFRFLKISIILSIVAIFIPKIVFLAAIKQIIFIISTILIIIAAFKLKNESEYFNRYWIFILLSLIPGALLIFLSLSITGATLGVLGLSSFGMFASLGMLYMILMLISTIISIVLEVLAEKNFSDGVKDLVFRSGNYGLDNIVIMSDEYYNRVKIVIIYLPLISLFIMWIPFVNLIWSLGVLIYMIYHFYKTFLYYRECEEQTPKFFRDDFGYDTFETNEFSWE